MPKGKHGHRRRVRPPTDIFRRRLPTLAHVCQSPDQFLAQLDIAAVNLMCAAGLPHADTDFGRMFHWLDEAARFFILMALAAVGLSTSVADLRKTGPAPFLLGLGTALVTAVLSLTLLLATAPR